MLYIAGLLCFTLSILVSIGLHELGHLFFAKKFGTLVTDYSIGFGKKIWSRKHNETTYNLRILPLGGFIKIAGMFPPVETNPEKSLKTTTGRTGSRFTQFNHRIRKTEHEKLNNIPQERMFYALTWWKKFIIMIAGPTVNLIISFLLLSSVYGIVGQSNYVVPENKPIVSTVAKCAVGKFGKSADTCAKENYSPAYAAGLKINDRVITFNNEKMTNWDVFVKRFQKLKTGEVFHITVERNGSMVDLEGSMRTFVRPSEENKNENIRMGFMGVSPKFHKEYKKLSPFETLGLMEQSVVEVGKKLGTLPGKVYNAALAIVGLEERDPHGPVSVLGGARYSGEIYSYDNPQKLLNTKDKVSSFFVLVAGFNLFIGVLNLVPLLPLDGGYMIASLWEGLKRLWARFRKREVDPVDIAKLMPLSYGVSFAFAIMGIILITADIVAPLYLFH